MSSLNYVYIFYVPGPEARVESVETNTLQLFQNMIPHEDSFSTLVSHNPSNVYMSRHANSLLPSLINVPTDLAPSPARRRDCFREGMEDSIAVICPGISSSSVTVTPRAVGRNAELFLPLHSHLVEEENRHLDVNGNDAAVEMSACCCLPYRLPSTTSAWCQGTRREFCSSSFAKDCWQRLCDWACCVPWLSSVTFKSFHCLLVLFASLGVGCIISGVVLGILRMIVYGSFLVLSVMFVGLGILLIVVVIIGWRCMPAGEEPCHRLFDQCLNGNARRTNQQESARRLDHDQWFGGVIYPEFRSRTPPPPYSMSVLDISIETRPAHLNALSEYEIVPNTPPPAYRVRVPNRGNGTVDGLPPSYHALERLRPGLSEALVGAEVHGLSRSTVCAISLVGGIQNSNSRRSIKSVSRGTHRRGHKLAKTGASRGLAAGSSEGDGRSPGPSSVLCARPSDDFLNSTVSASDASFRSAASSSVSCVPGGDIVSVDDDESVNDKLDSVI